MSLRTDNLILGLKEALVRSDLEVTVDRNEVTLVLGHSDLIENLKRLRDSDKTRFTQLVDLCGLDYQGHDGSHPGRFAVIYHLLSMDLNYRLRVKVFCSDDEQPSVQSVVGLWAGANWFEREAFDLFGIVFEGHPDLRRILTDYGFVGHPLRKDFPLSGNVEMRYDPVEKRVIYQPVTIEPREIVPRVIREESYGGGD
jgi:NADH-quinone oxidoreductase subunit C